MPRSGRREGSPFTGLGAVFMKEFADHLSSARMMVLMMFVIVFGALPVGLSLQELRNVTESDPFLFLRIFTSAPQRMPFSFTASLTLVIPLLAIGLGFDAVNSEFNRRTLSRVLSQPIYRDALLLGKFLGGLATLAVALMALWLIVLGAGLGVLSLGGLSGVAVDRDLGHTFWALTGAGLTLAVTGAVFAGVARLYRNRANGQAVDAMNEYNDAVGSLGASCADLRYPPSAGPLPALPPPPVLEGAAPTPAAP